MIYKYSQLTGRSKYDENKMVKLGIYKYHLGQLKLLFSEMIFLIKFCKPGNKVLYVGAAKGNHIAKLADLFPRLTFDLWDPEEFDIEKRSNINIFNRFFKNSDAEKYRLEGNNILFICDIRTIDIEKYKSDITKMNEITNEDMLIQKKWLNIIKPYYAHLKFRLPYGSGKTEYLKGTIYLQPFSPASTETRLVTNNYIDTIYYDNIEFDEKMAHFNYNIRGTHKQYNRWKTIMDKYNIMNNWSTSLSFYIIDYYLRKIKNIRSDENVVRLFLDIIKFHEKFNPKKYRIIYKYKKKYYKRVQKN